MNLNSPITARLTPQDRRPPRDGVTMLRSDITRGLPHRIDIAPQGLRILLTVATGQFRTLMNAASETTVSHGSSQSKADSQAGIEDTMTPARLRTFKSAQTQKSLFQSRQRACPRLVFVNDGKFIGQCPAIIGQAVLIPSSRSSAASAGTWIEVVGLSIQAGALVGGASTTSWIELAWRDIRSGSNAFDSRVLRPELADRLFYARNDADGALEIIPVDAEQASDTPDTRAQAGGLNWSRVPCWGLQFYKADDAGAPGETLLTLDHGGHFAETTMTLEGGLTPGRLQISLARLTDTDFALLTKAQFGATVNDKKPIFRRCFAVLARWVGSVWGGIQQGSRD
ncbi:hypothetical protein GQR58_002157 [Nymphon striatum]|nr:hypothetical protein GQR58_002157 [Nymphon striatum]